MQVVAGVMYKTPDGVERVAKAYLTIVCDGMYSNLRKHLSEPNVSGKEGCACMCVGAGRCIHVCVSACARAPF